MSPKSARAPRNASSPMPAFATNIVRSAGRAPGVGGRQHGDESALMDTMAVYGFRGPEAEYGGRALQRWFSGKSTQIGTAGEATATE